MRPPERSLSSFLIEIKLLNTINDLLWDEMTSGIEADRNEREAVAYLEDCEQVFVEGLHQRLIQVELHDVTDRNNQLVHEREWLLHSKDAEHLDLSGNLFAVESTLTGEGKVFVKCGPLPEVRGSGYAADLSIRGGKGGFDYLLHNTGPADLERWQVLDYKGGRIGRTAVLHDWQHSQRPLTEVHSIPRFISNSWGDRNRDARIRHDFILKEIDAAARLGVEVVQIDDGWQKGISANSSVAKEQGGVWHGFWDADPYFWTPHPERFPNGLQPVLKKAAEKGLEIGLWYAPDSSNEFANWRRDADQLLKLHREFGVRQFKLDGISASTVAARRNLRALLAAIVQESEGMMICDIDITAGIRPGYFGEMAAGPLFVENRYTDWHNYWPHFTLRNLWQLSQWIDPRRLRMEFLNNERNIEKYQGDPLAPAEYSPDTLFASIMFANPLGWFENTGLSEGFIATTAPLVKVWRKHRDIIFKGTIIPVGQVPDGSSWTGFCSVSDSMDSAYAVLFNERNPSADYTFILPAKFNSTEILHGRGEARVAGDRLSVRIDSPLKHLFVRLGR